MNYLIDTHVLLWYIVGDKRISKRTQSIIESPTNIIFLSNASLWEIAIKTSIGKLKLSGNLIDLREFLLQKGFKILEFDFDDLQVLQELPHYHHDPFDRLIIAQAKAKLFRIITYDAQVERYFESNIAGN